MASDSFAEKLKKWRALRNLKQEDLDAAIGKSRGHVAQLETGRLKPPPLPLCVVLAEALELPPSEVWEHAAPERLAALDPDLLDWHQGELDRARGTPLTPEEARVVAAVRRSPPLRALYGAVMAQQQAVERHVDRMAAKDPEQPRPLVELEHGINIVRALGDLLSTLPALASRQPGDQEQWDAEVASSLRWLLWAVPQFPAQMREQLLTLWINTAEALYTAWGTALVDHNDLLRRRMLATSSMEEPEVDRFLIELEKRLQTPDSSVEPPHPGSAADEPSDGGGYQD